MRRALLVLVLLSSANFAMMGYSREAIPEEDSPWGGRPSEPLFIVDFNSGPRSVGVVDAAGRVIVPFTYDFAKIAGNYIIVRSKGLVGLLDAKGRERLPCVYKQVFAGGFAVNSRTDNGCGRGHSGPYIFADNTAFDENLKQVNPKGTMPKEVILSDYLVVKEDGSDRLRIVKPDGSYAGPDNMAKYVVVYPDSLVAISDGRSFSLYGPDLARMGNVVFDEIMGYSDNLIAVRSGSRYGFVDMQGNVVLPIVYEGIGRFSEGLCPAKARLNDDGSINMSEPEPEEDGKPIKSRWGYIRKDGTFAIPPRFFSAYAFCNGIAHVTSINSYGSHAVHELFIDTEGKFVKEDREDPKFRDRWGGMLTENPPPKAPTGDWCVGRRLRSNDYVTEWSEGIYLWGSGILIDLYGRKLTPVCKKIGDLHEGLAAFQTASGEYGYLDAKGAVAIPPRFSWAGDFSEGLAPVSDGTYGFIDRDGKKMFELPKCEELTTISLGHAFAKIDGRWCIINREGHVTSDLKVDAVKSSANGIAVAVVYSQVGVIDAQGKTRITPRFTSIRDFNYGYAIVEVGSKWGVIDTNDHLIFEPVYGSLCYNDAWPYYREIWRSEKFRKLFLDKGDHHIPGRVGGLPTWSPAEYNVYESGFIFSLYGSTLQGVVSLSGEVRIPPVYDYLVRCPNGSYVAGKIEKDGTIKLGVLDKEGKQLIEPKYACAGVLTDGLMAVAVETGGTKKWGYIDGKDRMVIPPQFSFAGDFSEGHANVIFEDKVGVIDKTGKFIIPPHYNIISSFRKGVALAFLSVGQTSVGQLINLKGESLLDPSIQVSEVAAEGYVAYQKKDNGKTGIVDETGRWIVKPVYDTIGPAGQFPVPAVLGNNLCYVDASDHVVLTLPVKGTISSYSRGYLCIPTPGGRWRAYDVKGNVVLEWPYPILQGFMSEVWGK
ncbi:MAG: WG repeat-containing protein [Candidatus Brocadiia bacterium]